MSSDPLIRGPVRILDGGRRVELTDPVAMPMASAFLWNRRMMIQLNARGFAVAQFMQPEPAKYTAGPTLEAKTFMQPEQPFYAHHPGRFCYLKDEASGDLWSAPHEPCRVRADAFAFIAEPDRVSWRVIHDGVEVEMAVTLPVDDVAELWTLTVRNRSGHDRRLSLYPYFPIGYRSWMNQSGAMRPDLSAVVCDSITPYQKVEDWFVNRDFKDRTVLIFDTAPDAFECALPTFEGEGGLHAPSAITGAETLAGGDALYEIPVASLQYRLSLAPDEDRAFRFIFAPARDDAEIVDLRDRLLAPEPRAAVARDYAAYVDQGHGLLEIETPDPDFDAFVNHWLPRQVFYHGDVNRLTTDPQTRNLLQDHMGMVYAAPETARRHFLLALSQQRPDGGMPDGIRLRPDAELKYINQIPHTDHNVWLAIFLEAWLDETGDRALLDEAVTGEDGKTLAVFERVTAAMRRLVQDRDERGLGYIAQGDWCDPMNMVGWKGKGVSGWLTLAAAHAVGLWSRVCADQGHADLAAEFASGADAMNAAMNHYLWDGDWYGRGITDDGVAFGVKADDEGRIYLNPQAWSLLSGAADDDRKAGLIAAVEAELTGPHGVTMLGPPYTGMRDDVGRLTQKFPGSAENGAVYNHAAAFWAHALYRSGEGDRAFATLRAMLPGPDAADILKRGQLPVFVPNYYRGAWRLHPRTAGRSSQLFNTGTAAWMLRMTVEGLFGLRGDGDHLLIQPQLPSGWDRARATRRFRGATIDLSIERRAGLSASQVVIDGAPAGQPRLTRPEPGRRYRVEVVLPAA